MFYTLEARLSLRELIALLNLSSWCLVMVEMLFLAVQFMIVVFPDHTHLLFLETINFFLTGRLCYILRILMLWFWCILHKTKCAMK